MARFFRALFVVIVLVTTLAAATDLGTIVGTVMDFQAEQTLGIMVIDPDTGASSWMYNFTQKTDQAEGAVADLEKGIYYMVFEDLYGGYDVYGFDVKARKLATHIVASVAWPLLGFQFDPVTKQIIATWPSGQWHTDPNRIVRFDPVSGKSAVIAQFDGKIFGIDSGELASALDPLTGTYYIVARNMSCNLTEHARSGCRYLVSANTRMSPAQPQTAAGIVGPLQQDPSCTVWWPQGAGLVGDAGRGVGLVDPKTGALARSVYDDYFMDFTDQFALDATRQLYYAVQVFQGLSVIDLTQSPAQKARIIAQTSAFYLQVFPDIPFAG